MTLPQTPVWLTYGPSASGKSTWARDHSAGSRTLVRLSMDDVRASLGVPSGSPMWSKEFEAMAFDVMLRMALGVIESGRGLIFDNTHLSAAMPSAIAKKLRHLNVVYAVKDFTHVDRQECINRDARREGSAHVGAEVINRQFKTMSTAKWRGEPFRLTADWLNSFGLLQLVETYRPAPGLPSAFIIDVDGTVTLGPHNRSPYEWHKVGNDLPRTEIIYLANLLQRQGHQMLALSGRSETCRRQTLDWFSVHGLRPDRFLMRSAGDNRSDDLVKLDLFNNHVRNAYNVRQVFDDRDQVVTLWRLLGLQTNQVASGSF